MKKMDDLMNTLKLEDMISKRESDRKKKTLIWIFVSIGVAAAIAAIAYVVYQFVCPHCKKDDEFEDDFDDLFDDDDLFEDEDDIVKDVKAAEPEEEAEEEEAAEEEKAEEE